LYDSLNTTGKDTVGGTLFAPTNNAFKKLGPRANAFLFGRFGTKYLKAILEYHIVAKYTLYSNTLYDGTSSSSRSLFADDDASPEHRCHKKHGKKDDHKHVETRPAWIHLDLPTVLGKPLSIDLIRRGPFIEFKVNNFVHVAVQDGLASDGVIQVVNDVLLPPKTPGAAAEEERGYWNAEGEISVEELVERLQPFVDGETMKLDL